MKPDGCCVVPIYAFKTFFFFCVEGTGVLGTDTLGIGDLVANRSSFASTQF